MNYVHTHTNLKKVSWTALKQEFYQELLYVYKLYSSFYTFNDRHFRNFELSTCFRITGSKCHINTVVPSDDGPGEVW